MKYLLLLVFLLALFASPSLAYHNLKCFPDTIEFTLHPGSFDFETLTIWQENERNPFTVYLSESQESPYVIVDFSLDELIVPTPPLTNRTNVIVNVLTRQAEDYSGTVLVKNSDDYCIIPLNIKVAQGIEIDVSANVESKTISVGDTLYATILLEKKVGPLGQLYVDVIYRIKDPDGDVVDSKSSRVLIDKPRTVEYSYNLPFNAKEGQWIFEVVATSGNVFAGSADTFNIVYSKAFIFPNFSAQSILIYTAAITLIILSFGMTKHFLSSRDHRKLTERQLHLRHDVLRNIRRRAKRR